ncbi:MAG: ATP-dependent DNA helicase RecG [Patescibacteria group bacterium]
MRTQDIPIASVGRIGKIHERVLIKLGIRTCRDALFYYPQRFDDFSAIVSIAQVAANTIITVRGTIQIIRNRRSRNRRMIVTEALLADESGSIKVIWFNQGFLSKVLKIGDRVSLSGRTSENILDLTLVNPAYEKESIDTESTHTGRLVPVYPGAAGITQKQLRIIIRAAIQSSLHELSEWMPQEFFNVERLMGIKESINAIHFPDSAEQWKGARNRLAFDELFFLQLAFLSTRSSQQHQPAFTCTFYEDKTRRFIEDLPFDLTKSQKIAAWEIVKDLERSHPMNRLLNGDVGSGKTVVSAVALLNVALSGAQGAYMAPTEILATQVYERISALMRPFGISCALVTAHKYQVSSIKYPVSRKEALEKIHGGEIHIIIGTHALIQKSVRFNRLALVIVDEQHRFGVNQRKALREKNPSGEMPHLLSMTATPIPRSLSLALYGDLDLSILDEIPKGRKKIITKIVPSQYREWTAEFIRKECSHGRQAFVICPVIDPSDVLAVRSTTQEYERLRSTVFQNFRVGMLHGKMKAREKEDIMGGFAAGAIDILVCTSVIEVGIDIPNASVMLIEGAERFGLAQLHQFRGRVGRGEHQSYCFLFPTESARDVVPRLSALVKCSDGFELAEMDLKNRGHGDLLGERQSGIPLFKLASLADVTGLKKAREWAEKLFPQLGDYPLLRARLADFERDAHLE